MQTPQLVTVHVSAQVNKELSVLFVVPSPASHLAIDAAGEAAPNFHPFLTFKHLSAAPEQSMQASPVVQAVQVDLAASVPLPPLKNPSLQVVHL